MVKEEELKRMVEQLVGLLNDSNAGIAKGIIHDKQERPIKAVVVIDAGLDTGEVLDAIEAVTDTW